MIKESEWYTRPSIILAIGLAVCFALAGLGWGLKLVIPSIGTAFGIASAIISGGLVGTGVISSWIVPTASIGITLVGGATTVVILSKMTNKAKLDPFSWLLPVLSIFSAFIIDVSKQVYQGDEYSRIFVGTITAAIYFTGGLLWMRKGILIKIISCLLYLTPPLFIISLYVKNQKTKVFDTIKMIPFEIWISIIGLLIILFLVGILSFLLKNKEAN